MPDFTYTQEEFDDAVEDAKTHVTDNIEEYYDDIGTGGIDNLNTIYSLRNSDEWVRDSVIDNLCNLEMEDLRSLAEALVEEMECRL